MRKTVAAIESTMSAMELKADSELQFDERRERRLRLALVRGLQMLLLDGAFRTEAVAPVAGIVGAPLPKMDDAGSQPLTFLGDVGALQIFDPPRAATLAPSAEAFGPKQPWKRKRHAAAASHAEAASEEVAPAATPAARSGKPPMMPGTPKVDRAQHSAAGEGLRGGSLSPRVHSMQPEQILSMMPASEAATWQGSDRLGSSSRLLHGKFAPSRKEAMRRLPSLGALSPPAASIAEQRVSLGRGALSTGAL